ncbi:MAG: cobalamin biosynthesis protein CobD [Bacteroidales bacterium]|nr:cobalamin biosynthesis protein CobD [Bacteroidales bacterium]
MNFLLLYTLPIIIGWGLDLMLGDPAWLPHPVVAMGKVIAFFEKNLNNGKHRVLKGALTSVFLISATIAVFFLLIHFTDKLPLVYAITIRSIFVFFFLAGTTLIREAWAVFKAVDRSVEEGRKQVARIVGRETSGLTAQEIRIAALETVAENLSDGVIAPLFWLLVGGIPGMAAYKMINTLDSMIGYKTERYRDFGRFAAKTDDLANWIPARLTAFLMVIASGKLKTFKFVRKYARQHASPNSGYPESALAGILDVRFGGAHTYHGEVIEKPYIGDNPREVTTGDMATASLVNRLSEAMMIVMTIAFGAAARYLLATQNILI